MRPGIKQFSSRLKDKLSARVDLFEKCMMNNFKKNPDLSQVKTEKEWMEEFKKWSTEQARLEELVLSYIRGDDNES